MIKISKNNRDLTIKRNDCDGTQGPIWKPGVIYINVLQAAFTLVDPKSAKDS